MSLLLIAALIGSGVLGAMWHAVVRHRAMHRHLREADDYQKELLPPGWEICPVCRYQFPSTRDACPACSCPAERFLSEGKS